MHADAAAGGDEDVAVVQRVCEVGQAGVGSRTGRVDFGRTLHGERLVWPFGVEFLDKVVEAGLLLQAVYSGRPGCFFLQNLTGLPSRPICRGAGPFQMLKTRGFSGNSRQAGPVRPVYNADQPMAALR